MDGKKVEMTNEEIIKDIERSTGMPSYWKTIVLDLIHRLQDENAEQKAEIERLTKWKDKLQDTKDELEQQLIDTGFKEYCEENKRLTDENAELQKQVDELKAKIEQGTLIELPCVLKPYYLCGEWHCKIMIGFDKNSVPIMEYFHGKEKETVVSKAEKRLKELQK